MSAVNRWLTAAVIGIVVAATLFAAGFGIGRYVLSPWQPVTPTGPEGLQEQSRLLWEAWRLLRDNFYSELPLDQQEMIHGAIRGMVESLGDRHTMFLTPQQAEVFRDDLEGEFGGIGVTVDITEGGELLIITAIPDTPGDRAGLRAGDVVLKVDGTAVWGMDLAQAIALIRGPAGSDVSLVVRHPTGETAELVVTRALIEVPTTEHHILDEGVAYLAVFDCNARATAAVRAALEDVLKQRPRALILDLRGNPGGYLHVARDIADEFIDRGLLLTERDSAGHETVHRARRGGRATQITMAVLVDAGSASAAEIIAGAIQDNGRGVLVGERTFGKGSVQVTERLSDGSGLQITIRRWYTPNGRQIDGQGLVPEIEVAVSDEDLSQQQDPQLQAALAYLLSEPPV